MQGDLSLITSRALRNSSSTLQNLVQKDEDEWRQFLSHRAAQKVIKSSDAIVSNFACLYDAEHCGDSRLSELLTIYDRVDLLPQRMGDEWLKKHQISMPDLQELVRLKRVRIILPYSAAAYDPTLIEAVSEVDPSSIVLSRALAVKTITQGQIKEPFLYAPLTSGQRAAVLSALFRASTAGPYRKILGSYGQVFAHQHHLFMTQGALAVMGAGVGAYLGDAFIKLGKNDACIELMTCGAGVEWALGLGASYIPRSFGVDGGYDETQNCQLIASYLGRTKLRPTDPIANRMHIVSDGLLAVSNVPPLDVARNFHSLPASRFRNLARSLMETLPDEASLQDAVSQVNADVKSFERRADRLASWKIQSVLEKGGIAYAGHKWGWESSIAAAWLLDVLKTKLPVKVRDELEFAVAMLSGVATGSSLDAVIVSRSRKML